MKINPVVAVVLDCRGLLRAILSGKPKFIVKACWATLKADVKNLLGIKEA